MRKALFGAALAVVLASCSSSSSTVPPTNTITVRLVGRLQYVGDVALVTASEVGYTGPFTFQSTNGDVLALSLKRPKASTTLSARIVSPDGRVYVLASGEGTASITIQGRSRFSASPIALKNLTIIAAPDVKVAPTELSFSNTGQSYAKTVTVSQDAYAKPFREHDNCGGIADVTAKANDGGSATYSVTPVADGSCSATFTGGNTKSSTLPISVFSTGTIALSPASLTLKASAAATVKVTQANFGGRFSESDTCAKVADVAVVSNGNGKATYSVTPRGNGACNATFAGGNDVKAVLPISVSLPKVKVTPASLTFTSSGSASAKTVKVVQSGYSGEFAESDTCGGVASLVASSNAGGKATYTVTAVAGGACAATFTGGNKQHGHLAISVSLPGPVKVTPSSLQFASTGSGNAQDATASQTGYSGAFAEKDDCSGIVTISTSNHKTFTVTPVTEGSCTAVFTGGNSQTAALPISVLVPGDVTASPAPLNFIATGASNALVVTVTQTSYGGAFTEHDTCSGIATFSVLTNAGGTATYNVTPLAAGICQAAFTGGGGKSFVLGVTVTQTGFGIK